MLPEIMQIVHKYDDGVRGWTKFLVIVQALTLVALWSLAAFGRGTDPGIYIAAILTLTGLGIALSVAIMFVIHRAQCWQQWFRERASDFQSRDSIYPGKDERLPRRWGHTFSILYIFTSIFVAGTLIFALMALRGLLP